MSNHLESIHNFAGVVSELLNSDRDCVIAVGGFTGEGKSCFTSQLAKQYCALNNTYWGFDRMTWLRKEMMKWIDGEGENKEGQLPQLSVIIPDELFSMFYKRQWYEAGQIDAISTFNMCRDRHLLVIGNVPNFWDLDGGFTNRIRFYVYIPKRGTAWVFEQENNPFTSDPWNINDNKKIFRKNKNPYSCPNFLFEVHYSDWTPEEKEEYYRIRNSKRVEALKDVKDDRVEKYARAKNRMRKAMQMISENDYVYNKETGNFDKISVNAIAEYFDYDHGTISNILNGVRVIL